ncbi:metalloregulator ArsR/SmtB family transcription factor [Catenovulum maritimum]|uniref:ArsR family transcriptional regulator n=1 Tax=Catenovulum maritimum TaxID=1513271 RepID=A0A0J8H122_9ALTE|nr:metalloregulator ArsR/SmtB family transcription factor [Catenovulum maritimum]KMT66718.1 ArsR family transcriptional regulator [Catenovulum maritimum]
MKNLKKQSVLFLCTGNSARSQMAEALLRHKAADMYEVYSAGTEPESVDPRAIQALETFGVATKNLVAKHLSKFEGQSFDYVITLCDKASNECRSFPNASTQLAWDFPDPKARGGHNPFSTTLGELNDRLAMFVSVEGNNAKQNIDSPQMPASNGNELTLSFQPIDFYKCLTDEIRLKTLMLAHYHGELCVCELMAAMAEDSQPKVSRNLAVLKKAQVITDRKHGQWVFYRINPALPLWAKAVIAQTTENNIPLISSELERLSRMQNRPDKASFCSK